MEEIFRRLEKAMHEHKAKPYSVAILHEISVLSAKLSDEASREAEEKEEYQEESEE